MINHDGGKVIQNRVAEVICKNIQIERAVPEYEVSFDKFGRGRMHNIALFVAVFITDLYNENIAIENYRDYIKFMEKVGASSLKLPSKEVQGHEMSLQGERLVCLHEYFEL